MILELAPQWLIANIGAVSLILLGHLAERRFVSRTSIFANGIALNINYLPFSKILPFYLGLYLDAGLLMALLSIISYARRTSMPEWFYQLGLLYSSVAVGCLILVVRFF